VIGIWPGRPAVVIVAVIVAGAFLGVNNTLVTTAVMSIAPVERPVASATYGFVRFIGGGLAPYVASRLAVDINVQVPFYVGAATVAAAIGVLATGQSLLTRAEQGPEAELALTGPAGTPSDWESEPAPYRLVTVAGPEETDQRPPIVAAIDASTATPAVTDAAIQFAQLLDRPVEILHVLETDIIEELALDLEAPDTARDLVADNVHRVHAAGVAGSGHLIRVVSGHGSAGRRIADFANSRHATMIIIGAPGDSEIAEIYDASLTSELVGHAHCAVHIVAAAGKHRRSRVTQPVN
jgi:ACDE family multidrug resistance protein